MTHATMRVLLDPLVMPEDHGTIILFEGEVVGGGPRDGLEVQMAVDRRMADPIARALAAWQPGDRVVVEAEDWQIVAEAD